MKKIIILIVILAIAGGAGLLILNRDTETVVSNQEVTQQITELKEYTKTDVATHDKKEDCWTIIDGKVYDITSYVPRHPGGNNILSACGTDGTDFFNGMQAGMSGERNNHIGDSRAESELKKLLIGTVSN